MRGSRPTARSRRHSAFSARSTHYHVLPEAESATDRCHFRAGRLVTPGRARVPRAVDNHVVEFYAVRAGLIIGGLGRLFEPIPTYCRRRKILATATLDGVAAFSNDFPLDASFRDSIPVIAGLMLWRQHDTECQDGSFTQAASPYRQICLFCRGKCANCDEKV
jgi:hypothetical protein